MNKIRKENLFGDKKFYRKLFELAVPITFQALMLALVAAADAFMLGSIEQNSMAAVALATQIQFIQNIILSAAVASAAILGAQYWGKHDNGAINDIFCLILRLCGAISILFFIGCVFFSNNLMSIMTNDKTLIMLGIKYLKIAGWSYLLTGISQCYLTIMKVTEHAKTTAIISSSAVIINIFLNAMFIYGWFGVEPMNVQGAAMATLIARIIEFFSVVFVSYKKGYTHPNLKRMFKWNKLLTMDFSKCALPLLGACLLWGIGFASYSMYMGHMGKNAAAASSVSAVIRDLICCMCDGLASAGGIMVGNELGKGDLKTGKLYGERITKLSFICGIFSSCIMFLFTPVVLQFVKLSSGARQYLFGMLVIMSVYMIGRAVNTIMINGIFAAGGDTLFDIYSLAITMWGIAVPLAASGTFIFHWSPLVVYACTCLDEVGKIPWVLIHFKKYKWVKDLTRDNY